MITIPTGELVGILSDVIPFASPDKDSPNYNVVRLEWDGDMLHALACDRIRIGWSSWHPDDMPETDSQGDLFSRPGGADNPWAVNIPLDDAKDIVAAYKLSAKEWAVPLTVELLYGSLGTLKVMRSRDTGYSAITMAIVGQDVQFPNVRTILAAADRAEAVSGLAYGAKFLADFAKVRPRGPLQLTFIGATSLTHIAIGERFVGAIVPTQLGSDRDREREPVAAGATTDPL